MNKVNFKYKYILIFILSLLVFIGGLNYKRWYVTAHLTTKHISIIYSMSKSDIGYGNFEKTLRQEFRKQGLDVAFDRFYLDCTHIDTADEIEHLRRYLDLLESKSIDLILPVGDQATYSLLTTHHRLLSSIPVVACNVHFPDERLIEEYNLQKVYVLRDTPDLKRNIEFIKTLHSHTNMEIICNIDLTILGRKSFDRLAHVVDRKEVKILGYQKAYAQECDYKQLTEMIEYFNLTPGLTNDNIEKNELTIALCPFRYMRGASMLVMLEDSKTEQTNQTFLLDKFDMMSIPIVTALNIPSYSCIREGFGENAKIVGGYMATEEISAEAVADLATRLLKKEKIGMPKIRDLEKEYVLDWTYFSKYAKLINHVPNDVRFINYSFYARYQKELYLLGALFVLSFIVILISLLRTHRRSRMERIKLQTLKEAHKRLSLSMDGGKISLWNIQNGILEFDENYTHLVGLEQRRFTKDDILKYTHPDDVRLISAFYEALHYSHGMQMQRIRFNFKKGYTDQYQWYELRCSSLKDTKGEIMMAGIMQNIQNLVEREHQLILAKQIAEKAELKQSFLNNMSHEIRTPLNAIVGFTNLLVGEGSDEISAEEKETMLEIINSNNELLLKLVNDILEISHLDTGNIPFHIEECNATEVVKEIYETHRTLVHPSLQFLLELDETLFLPVRVDRLRFSQVILNFLSNASKFTRKGTVTLGCAVDKVHREVCIYVKDTGKGMDEKELMMIFDRFYKTDEFEQGSGLGLSISKVIIERLAGRIEVQSEVGKGSCFSVILSLANIT